MPDTANEAITYPASTANTNLWTHLQNLAEDADAAIAKRRGWGILEDPTATSSDGTGSSGTTATRDAVLGNYTFTSVANRRYRVHFQGLFNCSVVNDRFIMSIKDGGASTPVAGSTPVVEGTCLGLVAAGSNGRYTVSLTGTWTPSAGTHTLGIFLQRTNGTGIGTFVGARELWVEDIGPA